MIIKIGIVLSLVVALAVTAVGVYLSPNDLSKCSSSPSQVEGCEKVDAIVAVSGGNTPVRAAEAIRLYHAGWGDYVIFSGAAQDSDAPSNAAVMKQQALDSGVPAANILVEESSRTTHQNAEKTNQLLAKYNISRVIVVTSPYHQRRAGLEFRAITHQATVVLNHPAPDPDWPGYWWLTPRGWWLAVGELLKIGAVQSGNSQ